MSKRGKGGPPAHIEYSPDLVRRMAAAKRRTEARWAAKAGPVTVRRVGDPVPPSEGRRDPRG